MDEKADSDQTKDSTYISYSLDNPIPEGVIINIFGKLNDKFLDRFNLCLFYKYNNILYLIYSIIYFSI